MTAVDAPTRCPQCGKAALAHVRDDPPWCTACEWNLGQWPQPEKKRGRRAALRERRRAFEANRQLLRQFAGTLPERPHRTRAGVVLGAVSVLLLLFDIGLLVGGVILIITAVWAVRLLALFVILLGVECRPRFFKMDAHGEVTPQEVPSMWAVIEQARESVGAPKIDRLTITSDFNASCGHSGMRRQVVLSIGLPLWAALSPAGRLALLGHELGHLVNGDPTTSFVTQPALTTFGRLADVFDPDHLIDDASGLPQLAATILTHVIFVPMYLVCRGIQHALWRTAAQDHQRAEIYADALAVRLGGTRGATEVAQVLLFGDSVVRALRAVADDSGDPQAWQAEVARTLAAGAAELQVTEQRSMRYDVSAYASHPPSGLRSRLVRSWPATAPAIRIPVETMAAADSEMSRRYTGARRALVNR